VTSNLVAGGNGTLTHTPSIPRQLVAMAEALSRRRECRAGNDKAAAPAATA
jgi:hypothetical protein